MKILRSVFVLFSGLLLLPLTAGLTGCATYGKVILEDETGIFSVEVDRGPSAGYYYRGSLPKIPAGHMPPPGRCRVWLPGVPPGQQPPPGNCWKLQRQTPPGAWLIRGR
jgi:hypothetical protein